MAKSRKFALRAALFLALDACASESGTKPPPPPEDSDAGMVPRPDRPSPPDLPSGDAPPVNAVTDGPPTTVDLRSADAPASADGGASGPRVDVSAKRLYEHTVDPAEADPAADAVLAPQFALLDTRVAPVGKLVIYLSGANNTPSNARTMLRWLAAEGFHALSPHYSNDYGIATICAPSRDPDPDCHRKCRLEAWEGMDHSRHIAIKPANAGETRVVKMLAHLQKVHAGGDWAYFLDGTGLRWSSIIIAGHSHGASTAGVVGKVRPVHRAVMLSGPFDNRASMPAPWAREMSVSPLDRFYALSHAMEDQYQGHVRFWEAMGLGTLGPVTAVDAAQPPYGNSRQLSTSVAVGATQDPHGATHASGVSPKLSNGDYRLAPVWRHMFGK